MGHFSEVMELELKLEKHAEIARDQARVRDNADQMIEAIDRRQNQVYAAIDHAIEDGTEASMQAARNMAEMFSVLTIEQIFSLSRKEGRDTYKKRAADSERAARIDVLTQSNNRSVYHEQIKAATSTISDKGAAPDGKNHYFALVMFDLDRFKGINDDYGHDTGDAALQAFAETIKKITRTHADRRTDENRPEERERRIEPDELDSLFMPFGNGGQNGGSKSMSRLGGDEFTLLMNTRADSIEDAALEFEAGLARIRGELETLYFEHNGMNFPIVSSSGMHILEEDDTVETAYVSADTALAEHKKDKKERYEKTIEKLKNLGVPNLQVVEDKRKEDEISLVRVNHVLASLGVLQQRNAIVVHVRPDQQLTPAAETLEELGLSVIYDPDDDYPEPDTDESTPV